MRDKARVFDTIKPLLHAHTVVFGYSLVADCMDSTLRTQLAHWMLNRLKWVNNVNDRVAELRDELSRRFMEFQVDTHGPLAFFRASGRRTARDCRIGRLRIASEVLRNPLSR